HRFFVDQQLGDLLLVGRILIAERAIREEILDALEAELRELLLHHGPDAGQRVDRPRERLRPRKETRARPSVRRILAGKARRHADACLQRTHCGSSNQKNPTVPGPACVPTTAPSVVTSSICAYGRSPRTIFSSCC